MNKLAKGNYRAAQRHQSKICKTCGASITWWDAKNYKSHDDPDHQWTPKRPNNLDGTLHSCDNKVKIYTKEEIEQYKKERGLK